MLHTVPPFRHCGEFYYDYSRGMAAIEAVESSLDVIGANLKAARALGLSTIKVADPEQACREFGQLLGFDLIG